MGQTAPTTSTAFSALTLEKVQAQGDGTVLLDFRQKVEDKVIVQLVLAVADPHADLAEMRLAAGKRYVVSFREMPA